jgi:hypothetical protein
MAFEEGSEAIIVLANSLFEVRQALVTFKAFNIVPISEHYTAYYIIKACQRTHDFSTRPMLFAVCTSPPHVISPYLYFVPLWGLSLNNEFDCNVYNGKYCAAVNVKEMLNSNLILQKLIKFSKLEEIYE